jgi:beta-glucanase (GH16 family)
MTTPFDSARARSACRLLVLAAALATALPVSAQDWELVWSDEFDGTAIDSTKWTHEVNAWGGGNNELQYYTDRPLNSRIEDGKLVIEAHKETFTGPEGTRGYTSARLNTRYKGDWLYGRMEVRARMPGRQGLWPAIWMLPTDYAYGIWAASGEIDIAEHRGDWPTTLFTTIHHGGAWPNNTYTGITTTVPDLSEDFHVFALEWEREQMRWYFDGEEVYRLSAWGSTGGPYPAPFDQRFHMILNVAVGGNFLPDPPPDADYFPRRMEVDYVRVYQRDAPGQAPFSGTPVALPGLIQAEDFDLGGGGIAYQDDTPENIGGLYRLAEAVDIGASNDVDATPSVGWYGSGEWLEYTVNSPSAGRYAVSARHANESIAAPLSFALMDGDTPAATVSETMPATGSWTNWQTTLIGEIDLPAGDSVVRLTAPSAAVNVNWLNLGLVSDPPPSDLTATITLDPAQDNSRHRRWTITFNQSVEGGIDQANLAKTGTLAAEAELGYWVDGEVVTVLIAPLTGDTEGTVGFDLVGTVTGQLGHTLEGPLASALATIQFHPPGDVNKDGAFDLSDVLVLSNAGAGLSLLP